jgi:hypothetical protein
VFFVYDFLNINEGLGAACEPLYKPVRIGKMFKKQQAAIKKAKATSPNAYVCDMQRNVVYNPLSIGE